MRPLTGFVIGISISGGEDLARHGLTKQDINHVTVELCRRLVALGAQIVLGHQWRPRGIMEAVARFAQVYQSETPDPIIHNFLAWPDRAALSETDRRQLRDLVAIHEEKTAPVAENIDQRTFALRDMRRRMTDANHARLCLSGRVREKALPRPGFVPGVIEESALTLIERKPLYMSRMMGGATARLIDVLQRKTTVAKAFPHEMPSQYRDRFESLERSELASWCGLTYPELDELFDAQNLDTIVQLTSRGLLQRRSELLRQTAHLT